MIIWKKIFIILYICWNHTSCINKLFITWKKTNGMKSQRVLSTLTKIKALIYVHQCKIIVSSCHESKSLFFILTELCELQSAEPESLFYVVLFCLFVCYFCWFFFLFRISTFNEFLCFVLILGLGGGINFSTFNISLYFYLYGCFVGLFFF